jgi:hypothetical protein
LCIWRGGGREKWNWERGTGEKGVKGKKEKE